MAKKTQQESAKTRERILDAAEFVLSQRGVSSATVAHIAEEAGISRGAVYGHYRNKIDICLAMCRRAFATASIPPAVLATANVLDTLYLIGTYYTRLCFQPSSLQRVLQILYFRCEPCEENAPLFRFRATMEKLQRHTIKRVLRKGINNGELPADLDINAAFTLLDCLFGGIYHARQWNSHLREHFWDSVELMLRVGLENLCCSPYLHTQPPPTPRLPQQMEALRTLLVQHPPTLEELRDVLLLRPISPADSPWKMAQGNVPHR